MESTLANPQAAMRRGRCGRCGARRRSPCQADPPADHLQRWLDAYADGRVTKADLGGVIGGLVVITAGQLVPARASQPFAFQVDLESIGHALWVLGDRIRIKLYWRLVAPFRYRREVDVHLGDLDDRLYMLANKVDAVFFCLEDMCRAAGMPVLADVTLARGGLADKIPPHRMAMYEQQGKFTEAASAQRKPSHLTAVRPPDGVA